MSASQSSVDWFLGLLFGIIVGVLALLVGQSLLGIEYVGDYPGLYERLDEERDRCEARPGVIECVWDEDEANFISKGKP